MRTCVPFEKLHVCGNHFVVMRESALPPSMLNSIAEVAVDLCQAEKGIGADGLILMGDRSAEGVRARFLEPDGVEIAFCGNGVLVAAVAALDQLRTASGTLVELFVDTVSGHNPCTVITGEDHAIAAVCVRGVEYFQQYRISGHNVVGRKARGIPVEIDGTLLTVDLIDVAIPHAVAYVPCLQHESVETWGAMIRGMFELPTRLNVDFATIVQRGEIALRTYESGVERATASCGSGALAAARVFLETAEQAEYIRVHHLGGDTTVEVSGDTLTHKACVERVYNGEVKLRQTRKAGWRVNQ